MFNNIKKIYDNHKFINYQFVIENKKIDNIKSKFLKIDIPKTFKICHRIRIKYRGININFEFYDNKLNKTKANSLLNFILIIIKIIKTNRCSNFDFILINYNKKKTIPIDGVFKTSNINSGYTTMYENTSSIVVFRKNEMYKVLIHELIHGFRIGNLNFVDDKIDNLYPNVYRNEINEAVVESYACILNVVLYSLINKMNILENIKKEQNYSIKQAYNVYNIIKNNKQETNVVSYYILKSFLIQDVYNFLNNIENNTYNIEKILNSNVIVKKNNIKNMKMCFFEIGKI